MPAFHGGPRRQWGCGGATEGRLPRTGRRQIGGRRPIPNVKEYKRSLLERVMWWLEEPSLSSLGLRYVALNGVALNGFAKGNPRGGRLHWQCGRTIASWEREVTNCEREGTGGHCLETGKGGTCGTRIVSNLKRRKSWATGGLNGYNVGISHEAVLNCGGATQCR